MEEPQIKNNIQFINFQKTIKSNNNKFTKIEKSKGKSIFNNPILETILGPVKENTENRVSKINMIQEIKKTKFDEFKNKMILKKNNSDIDESLSLITYESSQKDKITDQDLIKPSKIMDKIAEKSNFSRFFNLQNELYNYNLVSNDNFCNSKVLLHNKELIFEVKNNKKLLNEYRNNFLTNTINSQLMNNTSLNNSLISNKILNSEINNNICNKSCLKKDCSQTKFFKEKLEEKNYSNIEEENFNKTLEISNNAENFNNFKDSSTPLRYNNTNLNTVKKINYFNDINNPNFTSVNFNLNKKLSKTIYNFTSIMKNLTNNTKMNEKFNERNISYNSVQNNQESINFNNTNFNYKTDLRYSTGLNFNKNKSTPFKNKISYFNQHKLKNEKESNEIKNITDLKDNSPKKNKILFKNSVNILHSQTLTRFPIKNIKYNIKYSNNAKM